MTELTTRAVRWAVGGGAVRVFDAIPSTNDAAREWLAHGAPDNALVIADAQTAGRGRAGRRWETPPGSALAFSRIVRCSIEPDRLGFLTMWGAVAVVEVCEDLGLSQKVGIKWPNDVMVGERKLAGILTEAVWSGGSLQGVIVGIGVNVTADFAPGSALAESAISLHHLLSPAPDRLALLGAIWEAMARYEWDNALWAAWRDRLNMMGRRVRVGDVEGVAHRIEESGALIVRHDDGTFSKHLAGDLWAYG